MTLQKGFTLIEVLIVMTVILLLSMGSLVGFNQFGKRQSINIAKDTLKNNLNEAKAKSLAQVIITTECKQSGRILVGYQISFNTSTNPDSYSLSEVCTSGATTLTPTVKTVSLQRGVDFNAPPSTPVRFLLHPGTVNAPATINLVSGSRAESITIDSSGVIK